VSFHDFEILLGASEMSGAGFPACERPWSSGAATKQNRELTQRRRDTERKRGLILRYAVDFFASLRLCVRKQEEFMGYFQTYKNLKSNHLWQHPPEFLAQKARK
jgi:hypothetical protein